MTFDVGGTLIQVWPSVGHIYAEVAAEHGIKGLAAQTLNARFGAAWRAAKRFRHSRSDWARLVDATFGALATPPPSRTFFDELYDRFSDPGAWRVFDDVIPTLRQLAERGLRLGIISNWDERLRPLLKRLKLTPYFEEIIVSREVGAAKPARAIFTRAARRLGLPPAAVLHVGDDWASDVLGARGAGMQSLLLDRKCAKGSNGRIKSLAELFRRLES